MTLADCRRVGNHPDRLLERFDDALDETVPGDDGAGGHRVRGGCVDLAGRGQGGLDARPAGLSKEPDGLAASAQWRRSGSGSAFTGRDRDAGRHAVGVAGAVGPERLGYAHRASLAKIADLRGPQPASSTGCGLVD